MPKFRQYELKDIHQEYLAGRELLNAGLLEDALTHFDRVLVRLPRRRRDRIYRIEGTPSRSHPDGVHWLPTVFRDVLLAKVYCLNELGRFDDAYMMLERAVELDPENPQVYAEIGFAHGAQDNLTLAKAAYTRALELEPENPAHLRALAHLALLQEDYVEATALARRALTMEPDSIQGLHQLAYANYRQGNLEEAVRALDQAVNIDPTDRESMLRLAGTLREAGRLREAITRLESYFQYDADDPEALGMMTDLLQQDGTAPELFSHAQRLLTRNPRDPNAFDLLAWGNYQRGEVAAALKALRQLVLLEPMQAQHHFKLGIMYETQGNLQSAMASLLRAVGLGEGAEIGEMALEAISNLDQVQIEQVLARAESDTHFRYGLTRDPEQTLLQSGYLLSPLGFQMMQSLDFNHGNSLAYDQRPRTIH